MQSEPPPDFKRGRYVSLIVFLVVAVLGIVGVIVLSGVMERKRARDDANKEGCPCNCDRSVAMAAEVRAQGGEPGLRAIDESLATISERERGGYITEAMIEHRLR